jgi:hypothetical protein
MDRYEVWCRPHGRPDQPATLAFFADLADHRSAWHWGMQRCFTGGPAVTLDGETIQIPPRRWTVCKVKLHVETEAADPGEDGDDGWPRPDPEFLSPATRDKAVQRLYAGRCYDALPIRRAKTVLLFSAHRGPVVLSSL